MFYPVLHPLILHHLLSCPLSFNPPVLHHLLSCPPSSNPPVLHHLLSCPLSSNPPVLHHLLSCPLSFNLLSSSPVLLAVSQPAENLTKKELLADCALCSSFMRTPDATPTRPCRTYRSVLLLLMFVNLLESNYVIFNIQWS